MKLSTTIRYRKAFDSLKGPHMRVLVEVFAESDPLSLLATAAKLTYNRPGVRRASVLKQLRENEVLATYGKLHKRGVISGPSVEEFVEQVDCTLKGSRKHGR